MKNLTHTPIAMKENINLQLYVTKSGQKLIIRKCDQCSRKNQ